MNVLVLSAVLLFNYGSTAFGTDGDVDTCSGLTQHKNGSMRSKVWLMGQKYVNILMSSKENYDSLSEILTGGPAKEGSEKTACLQVTWKMSFEEKRFDFTIHGFKASASYQCPFSNHTAEAKQDAGKPMCRSTSQSTNQEWANKLEPGKPITILSDDKSYSLDVRCPKGKRLWYVKSINKTLDSAVKEEILKAVKAAQLPCQNFVEIDHEKCTPPAEMV